MILREYMNEYSPIFVQFKKRNNLGDLALWEHHLASEQTMTKEKYGRFIHCVKRKIILMNLIIDQYHSHQHFILNADQSCFNFALLMCKYPVGDLQYQQMRHYFLKMRHDIDYLMRHDNPYKDQLHCNPKSFDKVINGLKTIHIMKKFKKPDINQHHIDYLSPQQQQDVRNSFTYQLMLVKPNIQQINHQHQNTIFQHTFLDSEEITEEDLRDLLSSTILQPFSKEILERIQ